MLKLWIYNETEVDIIEYFGKDCRKTEKIGKYLILGDFAIEKVENRKKGRTFVYFDMHLSFSPEILLSFLS